MGILFPEVRTTSVRLIWQPPAAPNGIILGKSAPFLFPFQEREMRWCDGLSKEKKKKRKAEMRLAWDVSAAPEK